jgi:hypothetical protein
MPIPRIQSRPFWALALTLAIVAGGLALRSHLRHSGLPTLPVSDVREGSREAGKIEKVHGSVSFRDAAEESGQLLWTPGHPGVPFTLGTLFRCESQSGLELSTAGLWSFGLEGEGEFVMRDARRSEDSKEHVASVYVKKGTFRAKPAAQGMRGYLLEISTATAKILLNNGEIGMEVGAGGKGRMWLVSGKATVTWNDGRRKELALRGLENL